MADVEVVGVYPVEEAPWPCHLIELRVTGSGFDLNDVTQEQEGVRRDNWQSPWDEKLLDSAGTVVVAEAENFDEPGVVPCSTGRIVFFFHDLDLNRPLKTAFGDLQLPAESPRPSRLAFVEYEQP